MGIHHDIVTSIFYFIFLKGGPSSCFGPLLYLISPSFLGLEILGFMYYTFHDIDFFF